VTTTESGGDNRTTNYIIISFLFKLSTRGASASIMLYQHCLPGSISLLQSFGGQLYHTMVVEYSSRMVGPSKMIVVVGMNVELAGKPIFY